MDVKQNIISGGRIAWKGFVSTLFCMYINTSAIQYIISILLIHIDIGTFLCRNAIKKLLKSSSPYGYEYHLIEKVLHMYPPEFPPRYRPVV